MKLRHIILTSVLATALAACSGGPSTSASEAIEGGISVKEAFGTEPTIVFDSKATPPDHLVIHDLNIGDGTEVVPGSTVEVNYKGASWTNGGQIFDSSFERGETISFNLDQVIPGWRDGLVGQKVNGRRVLVIPPNLGYGPQSPSPAIAANDTLVFVVDLISVQPPSAPEAPATPAADAPGASEASPQVQGSESN